MVGAVDYATGRFSYQMSAFARSIHRANAAMGAFGRVLTAARPSGSARWKNEQRRYGPLGAASDATTTGDARTCGPGNGPTLFHRSSGKLGCWVEVGYCAARPIRTVLRWALGRRHQNCGHVGECCSVRRLTHRCPAGVHPTPRCTPTIARLCVLFRTSYAIKRRARECRPRSGTQSPLLTNPSGVFLQPCYLAAGSFNPGSEIEIIPLSGFIKSGAGSISHAGGAGGLGHVSSG